VVIIRTFPELVNARDSDLT